jgi:hypothetical protein
MHVFTKGVVNHGGRFFIVAKFASETNGKGLLNLKNR